MLVGISLSRSGRNDLRRAIKRGYLVTSERSAWGDITLAWQNYCARAGQPAIVIRPKGTYKLVELYLLSQPKRELWDSLVIVARDFLFSGARAPDAGMAENPRDCILHLWGLPWERARHLAELLLPLARQARQDLEPHPPSWW